MNNNPYQQYKNTQVKTADAKEAVAMLYNGAIKFIKQAETGLEEKDYETVNNSLRRTQAIVTELRANLDLEQGGEIAKNLDGLYEYMNRRLMEANVNKDLEAMQQVKSMIQELKETWQQARKKAKSENRSSQQTSTAQTKGNTSSSNSTSPKSGGISFEG